MDQERKNVQSTKAHPESLHFKEHELIASNDSFPEKIATKTNSCFYMIYDLKKRSQNLYRFDR